MIKFEELPDSIQEKIKATLKAYADVDVWFENGRYTFDNCIKAKYAPDHKYVGTYTAEEIYTEEERIVNYANEFHDFPHNYKGVRDYGIMHDYDATYKLVNGNIVKA